MIGWNFATRIKTVFVVACMSAVGGLLRSDADHLGTNTAVCSIASIGSGVCDANERDNVKAACLAWMLAEDAPCCCSAFVGMQCSMSFAHDNGLLRTLPAGVPQPNPAIYVTEFALGSQCQAAVTHAAHYLGVDIDGARVELVDQATVACLTFCDLRHGQQGWASVRSYTSEKK